MFQRLSEMMQGPQVPEVDVEEADRQFASGAQMIDVREPAE